MLCVRSSPSISATPGNRSRTAVGGPLLLLLGLVTVAGCQQGSKLPPLGPVKGKVTVNGKPLTSGQVTVWSERKAEKDEQLPTSSGKINSDGTYEIFTGGQAGAPLGPAKATVSPSMETPGDKKGPKMDFNPIFTDLNQTTLRFTVVEKAAPGTYDLKLKK